MKRELSLVIATLSIVLISGVYGSYPYPRDFYEKLFFEHMQAYKLEFKNGDEFLKRLNIFIENVDIILTHNEDLTKTYSMGLNQFAHLTFEEFREAVGIGGTRPRPYRDPSPYQHFAPTNTTSLPEIVDWSGKGAVTPIKDQGNCGSCWAFSATGAMEGAFFLRYGSLQSFSEQQLVSCAPSPLEGCNGGLMDDAYDWVISNQGLASEADYPYTSGKTGKSGKCEKDKPLVPHSTPKKYIDVQPKDVDALKSAVAQQPVAIAIEADQLAFQFYRGGVLTGRCGQNLDHGVLLVGYGTLNGIDFWKIKNSWGSTWGDKGFVLIERSSADKCGVLDAPSYPIF
eukprot:gene8330-9182_t